MAAKKSLKRIDATLTIHVQYNVPSHHMLANTYMEVNELLATATDHIVRNGLLSGDSELEVADWRRTIDISVPPPTPTEKQANR